MGKAFWLVVGMLSVLLVAATSRSDDLSTTEPPPPVIDFSEPATVPLGANPPRDPFTPFDVGSPSSSWQYDDLSAADQESVNRGLDTDAWRGIHDIYGAALTQRAAHASAEIAQRRLGLRDLAETGVVP